jgi:hypothetical protein
MTAILLAALAIAWPGRVLLAQDSDEGNFEAAARLISDGTRELIDTEIQMTEAERERFWQVYEVFDREMDLLGAQYVRLLETYFDRYLRGALTEVDANRLTDEYLTLQIAMLRVRQKYLPEFRKVIGGIRTTQLYQLQNKVKAEVDAALAEVVPLAELEPESQ